MKLIIFQAVKFLLHRKIKQPSLQKIELLLLRSQVQEIKEYKKSKLELEVWKIPTRMSRVAFFFGGNIRINIRAQELLQPLRVAD